MPVISDYHHFSHHIRPAPSQPRRSDYALLQKIRDAAGAYAELDDELLPDQAAEVRRYIESGVPLLNTEVLVPSFALTLEAVRRCLGMVYYDVQLLAGLALSTGALAEMKTGEGKTIVAALPACLYGLSGMGSHVATVNSYLAERDWELMRQPLEMLGLSVGLSKERAPAHEKRRAYECDVTYSTGYELGFDFLRDQATLRSRREPVLGESFRNRLRGVANEQLPMIQRGHYFAIIDEVDSVLVDEANTPLILSQAATANAAMIAVFELANSVAQQLVLDHDYTVDRRKRTLKISTEGRRKIYEGSSVPESGLCRPWATYVEQALRAQRLLRRDVDYVVDEGKVMLVDQSTGRIFADRNWRDGLHQAVEFKEQVEVTGEKQSIARVSRQRYFGLYETLAGMSGTCTGQEREFREFYNLPVVVIPERLPNQRANLPTRFFADEDAKWNAIAADVELRHRMGQPVLVGTRTIDESVQLSNRLVELGVEHRVLNGRQDDEEADIVAVAGEVGSVLIATNMAGRGTDIELSKESEARGGLHVIATQRQDSARVDRQLIGRSARQGRPGSCQTFVSASDELFVQHDPYAGERVASACARLGEQGGTGESFEKQINRAQKLAERQSYEQRCELYRHDQWLNDVLMTVAEKSKSDKENAFA